MKSNTLTVAMVASWLAVIVTTFVFKEILLAGIAILFLVIILGGEVISLMTEKMTISKKFSLTETKKKIILLAELALFGVLLGLHLW